MMLIQIAGRLGRDPETRFTPSGQKVTTITVATNVRKGGKDETVWWRVTVWGERFDKLIAYLKKGSAIIVVGEMHKPEIWTDKEGRPQVSMEMTAEIIKFSPFGNPDQKQEQSTGNAAAGQGGFVQANQSNNGGYSDFGNSAGHSTAGANNSFGSFQEASPARYGHGGGQNEEDPLPF